MEISSNAVSITTPKANVTDPTETTPPGTIFCHEDAKSKMGPQKNPRPNNGKTVKKIRPTMPGSPGQISPNLRNRPIGALAKVLLCNDSKRLIHDDLPNSEVSIVVISACENRLCVSIKYVLSRSIAHARLTWLVKSLSRKCQRVSLKHD